MNKKSKIPFKNIFNFLKNKEVRIITNAGLISEGTVIHIEKNKYILITEYDHYSLVPISAISTIEFKVN